MKQLISAFLLACIAAPILEAQVVVTGDDMFNQPGQYFLAYSNAFDPTSPTPASFSTSNGALQGGTGAGQIWDFSSGPTNVVYRFDYLAPTNVDASILADFPNATVIEKQTDQGSGSVQYLFFQQVPNMGRQVYGYYAHTPPFDNASTPFASPIVDFPAHIAFGDQWSTSAVYSNSVSVVDPTDPTSGGSVDVRITQTSDLQADAAGTVLLPDELSAFGDALRVNEAVTINIEYFDDTSGTYQPLETDYARNFYWLMPGRGIVAALASTQNSGVLGGVAGLPANNFPTATQFWRQFHTNKTPTSGTGGCVTPDAVAKVKILFNSGSGQVLLSWGKANCASQYQVQYTTNAANTNSWKFLGATTNQLLMLDTTRMDQQRFYRVVSVK
jgi:hypothetical protein